MPKNNIMEMQRFFYSEIVPEQASVGINVHNLIYKDIEKGRSFRVYWPTYDSGKIRNISMPYPENFKKIYLKFKDIEKDFFLFSKSNCQHAIAQYPISIRKRKVIKNKTRDIFSPKFFRYANNLKYNKITNIVSQKASNGKVISYIDLSNYFNSIYIHSIEWVFQNGYYWSKKVNASREKNNLFPNKLHYLALLLSSGETNGLPIGPNLSRLIAHFISCEIDKIIKESFSQYTSVHQIYRFIDDFFIIHNKEVDVDAIIDTLTLRLSYLNIKINKSKTKINNWKPMTFDWSALLDELHPKALTSLINKIKRSSENKGDTNSKIIPEIHKVMVLLVQHPNKILNFRANQLNHLLKSFILFKDDKKMKSVLNNFSHVIWKIILKHYKSNPGVLNTFSPLLYILNDLKKFKKNRDLIKRILKINVSGIEEYLFSFAGNIHCINSRIAEQILLGGYNLIFIKGSTRKTTHDEMIKRLESPFIY